VAIFVIGIACVVLGARVYGVLDGNDPSTISLFLFYGGMAMSTLGFLGLGLLMCYNPGVNLARNEW